MSGNTRSLSSAPGMLTPMNSAARTASPGPCASRLRLSLSILGALTLACAGWSVAGMEILPGRPGWSAALGFVIGATASLLSLLWMCVCALPRRSAEQTSSAP